jgi:Concanavalin A-like lectin/glucanases superfamily
MQRFRWHRILADAAFVAATLTPMSGAMTIWKLDSIQNVGGHATELIGTPAVQETPIGQAIVFDGVDDGLLVPVNPIAGWPQFTIEILFRPEAPGSFEQRFLHLGEPNGSRALIELRLRPDGQWYLDTFLRVGETQLPLIDDTKLHPSGQWFWVALAYDGKVMSHYVDGVFEKSGELAIAPLPAGQASLGMRMTHVSWFHGAIREVRFHDEALAVEKLQRMTR